MLSPRGTIFLPFLLTTILTCSTETPSDKAPSPVTEQQKTESGNLQFAPDSSLADQDFVLAEQHLKRAMYDSAIVYFEKASEIYEGKEYWPGYVRCLGQIGFCLTEKIDYQGALQILEKAIAIGSRRLGARHIELSRCYNNMATLHWREGNLDQALVFHHQALASQLATLGRGHLEVADSYLAIGRVLQAKGDHDRALSFKEKALAIRLATLGDQNEQVADVYNSIAIDYAEKSDYDKALEFFLKALSTWRSSLGENHPRISFSYHNIGMVYFLMGNYKLSLANLQQSLKTKLATIGEKHFSTLQTYISIGLVQTYDSDYKQALHIYEKAIPLAKSVLGTKHEILADGYNNLGIIYRRKEEYERALDYHSRSLSIYHQIFGTKNPKLAEAYNDIGLVYLEKGDYEKTIDAIQAAINANISGFNSDDPYQNPPLLNILSESELLKSLSRKAQIFVKRYTKGPGEIRDLQISVSTYDHAVRLMENMRSGYKAEGSKLNLAQNALTIYEHVIGTTLRLYRATQNRQYLEKAFNYAEKSKAGILLEKLAEAEAKQFANIPDSLLEKERQLRIDLAYYDRSIAGEQLKGEAAGSSKLELWRDKKFDLEREYEALLVRFEKDYRDYYDLKYQVNTASVQEVQEELLDENMALVEYFNGADSLFIFTITHTGFEITTVAKDSSFERQIEQLRRGIIEKHYQQYVQAGHSLYRTLLEPGAGYQLYRCQTSHHHSRRDAQYDTIRGTFNRFRSCRV